MTAAINLYFVATLVRLTVELQHQCYKVICQEFLPLCISLANKVALHYIATRQKLSEDQFFFFFADETVLFC